MLGFLIGCLFPVQADLRIALAERDAGHGKIHADFAALAGEVGAQTLFDLFRNVLGDADDMLGGPGQFIFFLDDEAAAGNLALRADKALGKGFALVDIAADRTYKFLHNTPHKALKSG